MTPTVPGDLSKWEHAGCVYKYRADARQEGPDVHIVVPPGFMSATLYAYYETGQLSGRVEVEIRTPMEMIERAALALKAAIAIGLVSASDEGKVGG